MHELRLSDPLVKQCPPMPSHQPVVLVAPGKIGCVEPSFMICWIASEHLPTSSLAREVGGFVEASFRKSRRPQCLRYFPSVGLHLTEVCLPPNTADYGSEQRQRCGTGISVAREPFAVVTGRSVSSAHG